MFFALLGTGLPIQPTREGIRGPKIGTMLDRCNGCISVFQTVGNRLESDIKL